MTEVYYTFFGLKGSGNALEPRVLLTSQTVSKQYNVGSDSGISYVPNAALRARHALLLWIMSTLYRNDKNAI